MPCGATRSTIHETSGPTELSVGAVPDGAVLKRDGATAVGVSLAAARGVKVSEAGSPPTKTWELDAGSLSAAVPDPANDYGVFFDASDSNLPKKALLSALGGGGGSVPTGTGFRHVTSGAEDAAAKLVEKADLVAALQALLVPTGAVLPFAGSAAPTGYLACDGSLVSRTTYADLFAAIGTTFGAGDGSTTFAVPDLRGKFPQGADGTDARGATGGSKTPTITDAGHAHGVTEPVGGHTHTAGVSSNNVQRQAAAVGNNTAASGATVTVNGATSGVTVDSGTASISTADGRPPFLAVGFIIKT